MSSALLPGARLRGRSRVARRGAWAHDRGRPRPASNDFVGHRPVAILETGRRASPTITSAIGPCLCFCAGPAWPTGRYHDLVRQALDILAASPQALLHDASFNPELLDELALDLRAPTIHGHPVNRRPNYVFGEWDPHHIDNQGRYRRYVCRKITLDALLERVEQGPHGNARRAPLRGPGRCWPGRS